MAKEKHIRFNVKNVKYALKKENGTYDTQIKDLAYCHSLTLESEYEEKKIYGDGQPIATIATDKGMSGTLSVVTVATDYDKDCGRLLETDKGTATIQQKKSQPHAIYFEIEANLDGKVIVAKNWLLNCTSGKPSETYEQTQENPSFNNIEYPINVLGELLRKTNEQTIYLDENGQTINIYKVTALPTDAGYNDFDKSVPLPKHKAVL